MFLIEESYIYVCIFVILNDQLDVLMLQKLFKISFKLFGYTVRFFTENNVMDFLKIQNCYPC